MKPTHILTTLCLLCLLIAPAAAADSIDLSNTLHIKNPNTPILHHPHGYTLNEVKAIISEIISDKTLRPHQKLQAQTEACGMDSRLKAWLEAERDEKTGEPIYSTTIPILTPILAAFGLVKDTPSEPYSEDEGREHWETYHSTWLETYVPSGEFGGPIS